ncbi:hypothetical protein ALC60_11888 [Trachymyrmex zeteki]|uniref:Uncharacterized protein n=1 Tax=Mycetomoellerius zeteki TaxID=64791 RepID=A0A151WLW1_9HYME|nr:hypothetical protein ALC60_11888 [Trachymyrmex zeteki]
MNAINVTSNLHSFLRDVEYRACMHENRIDELFRVRGFHTKTPQFFLMRKTHLSARAASLLASCRSFPTFVGVARERGETDSLSRTLTAVHVRPFVREVRVSHAATSPAGVRLTACRTRLTCRQNCQSPLEGTIKYPKTGAVRKGGHVPPVTNRSAVRKGRGLPSRISVSGVRRSQENAAPRGDAILADSGDRMLTARSGPLGLGVPRTLGPAEGSDHLFLLPERALGMDSTHLRQDLAGLDFNLHLNLLHTAPRGNVWLCELSNIDLCDKKGRSLNEDMLAHKDFIKKSWLSPRTLNSTAKIYEIIRDVFSFGAPRVPYSDDHDIFSQSRLVPRSRLMGCGLDAVCDKRRKYSVCQVNFDGQRAYPEIGRSCAPPCGQRIDPYRVIVSGKTQVTNEEGLFSTSEFCYWSRSSRTSVISLAHLLIVAHYGRGPRHWLNIHFPRRWIGRTCPIIGTFTLDFFAWDTPKQKVYAMPVNDLQSLKRRIVQVCEKITDAQFLYNFRSQHLLNEVFANILLEENFVCLFLRQQLHRARCKGIYFPCKKEQKAGEYYDVMNGKKEEEELIMLTQFIQSAVMFPLKSAKLSSSFFNNNHYYEFYDFVLPVIPNALFSVSVSYTGFSAVKVEGYLYLHSKRYILRWQIQIRLQAYISEILRISQLLCDPPRDCLTLHDTRFARRSSIGIIQVFSIPTLSGDKRQCEAPYKRISREAAELPRGDVCLSVKSPVNREHQVRVVRAAECFVVSSALLCAPCGMQRGLLATKPSCRTRIARVSTRDIAPAVSTCVDTDGEYPNDMGAGKMNREIPSSTLATLRGILVSSLSRENLGPHDLPVHEHTRHRSARKVHFHEGKPEVETISR